MQNITRGIIIKNIEIDTVIIKDDCSIYYSFFVYKFLENNVDIRSLNLIDKEVFFISINKKIPFWDRFIFVKSSDLVLYAKYINSLKSYVPLEEYENLINNGKRGI